MEMKEERPPFVQFEVRAQERRNEKGELYPVDVDFALVTPPYSKDCVELIAVEWLANLDNDVKAGRFPAEWANKFKEAYKFWKAGQEPPVEGTALKGWTLLGPSQLKMLLAMGMRSVEDVAGMNDEGMTRYGMGALDLRNKAQAFLRAQAGPGKLAAETAALKANVAQLEEQNRLLREQNETLAKEAAGKRKAS